MAYRTLIYNIKQLVNVRSESRLLRGGELAGLPCIGGAWVLTEGSRIADYGPMSELAPELARMMGEANEDSFDATGRLVLPAWCDSHTHLVYAGSREAEFVDKIQGLSYAEIAARGGGILSSARLLAAAPEEQLFAEAWQRLQDLIGLGTGAIEIKSGYGLTVDGELKMLRVIQRLKEKAPIPVKATFLGAHSFPDDYRVDHAGYIRIIIEEMLPVIAREGLADYIDVFCENGFYSIQETEEILAAGKRYGLQPKIHANQLHVSGGVETGVRLGALSVDHLERMDGVSIGILAASDTVGTLLPTAAF
ncbi:MAG TPA: imidazolonepropionase, partial [Puia sp.]|nr:imidazolonepropionase [Puia sp.]